MTSTGACCQESQRHIEDLAWLIEAEYREMPGMRLTFAQAKRLWNLSSDDCRQVLDYLVSSGRLAEGQDHRFCREADSP